MRKVRVWVEKVFRGKKIPGDVFIYRTSYKADYRLIPKDEEEKYTKICADLQRKNVTPYVEYPPLFKELMLKDLEKKGIEVLKFNIFFEFPFSCAKYNLFFILAT